MSQASRLAARLPISFETAQLERDWLGCQAGFREYTNPLNVGPIYVAPLIAPGGSCRYLDHYPGAKPFAPTRWLRNARYFQRLLGVLPGPKFAVRLIKIPPGGGLAPHRDNWRGFAYGTVRLHVPIVSDAGVVLRIGRERFHWRPGELWYGDFSEEHEVHNGSARDRIHLVIDLGATRELASLIPPGFLGKRAQPKADAPQTPRLPRRELRKFCCEFPLPRGFLPLRNFPAGKDSARARIELSPGGDLILRAQNCGALLLKPVGGNALAISGAGAGSRIRIVPASNGQREVELSLRGGLYLHPVTGEGSIRNFRYRSPVQPASRV